MEQPCRTVEELLERPWVQGNLEYLFGKENLSLLLMTFIDATLDVLFIRRAVNPQDRWSGQLAFPGGRRENNEDDAQCCIRFGSLRLTLQRETMEEIGLDLNNGAYLNLGRTWDVQIPPRGTVHTSLSNI